ncbi:MAG: lysophospholipid acyltransferase family protein [Planctomycetota bacterium]
MTSASKPRRRRRWTRRFSNRLALLLGPMLFRLLSMTWRVKILNLATRDDLHKAGSPPVISFWHQQIPAALGSHRGYPVRVMVSLNRDGAMIANLAKRLGFKSVRGSSSKGAGKALREMAELAKGPEALGFTPDGPRGPLHSIAPGVIYMAALSSRPLLTVGFAASRAWRAGSWDRMVIPKPFARIVVFYDDALGVPDPAAAKEGPEQEAMCRRLKERMDHAESVAQAALSN